MYAIGLAALIVMAFAIACGEEERTTPPTTAPLPTYTPLPSPTPTPYVHKWKSASSKPDPVSGLTATQGFVETANEDSKAALVIRCVYGHHMLSTPFIQVVVFTTIESEFRDMSKRVTIRVDEDEPISDLWHYAHYANGDQWKTGLFLNLSNTDEIPFDLIERMRMSQKVGVQFWSGAATIENFIWDDLSGFDKAYREVEVACVDVLPTPAPTRIPPTPVPTLPPGTVVEELSIMNFQHVDAEVKAGTIVIWTNNDKPLHTVTHINTGGGRLFDSRTIAPDAGFRYHFTEPGIYEYQCLIHPVNMKATITVTE